MTRIPAASMQGTSRSAEDVAALSKARSTTRIPRPLPRRLQALAAPRVHFWQQCEPRMLTSIRSRLTPVLGQVTSRRCSCGT